MVSCREYEPPALSSPSASSKKHGYIVPPQRIREAWTRPTSTQPPPLQRPHQHAAYIAPAPPQQQPTSSYQQELYQQAMADMSVGMQPIQGYQPMPPHPVVQQHYPQVHSPPSPVQMQMAGMHAGAVHHHAQPIHVAPPRASPGPFGVMTVSLRHDT